ncbi:hypothetical protein ACN26Z_20500 [Verrucosispora sp. WMMD703]|uniref:hypothetical protein n=1 Tax=Verrucosispora sp. WMMD703 TaxID=3403463 RepID=UPI003B94F48C
MIAVGFIGFGFTTSLLGPDVAVKQGGLGMAVAVLIDATIVRMVLVPAVIELCGKANWWMPGHRSRPCPCRPGSRTRPASDPFQHLQRRAAVRHMRRHELSPPRDDRAVRPEDIALAERDAREGEGTWVHRESRCQSDGCLR